MKHIRFDGLLRLYSYAKQYRGTIVLAAFYSFLNTLFYILPEILIGLAVDVVVYRDSSLLGRLGVENLYNQLLILGGLTLFVWVVLSISEYLYATKWRYFAQTIQHQLRIDAYTHIQGADMNYFENVSNGNLTAILNDDINQLERFFDNGLNIIIHIISSTLIVGGIFFFLAPKVAFWAF
jgi:ATP-binding cassette subfamily B protein